MLTDLLPVFSDIDRRQLEAFYQGRQKKRIGMGKGNISATEIQEKGLDRPENWKYLFDLLDDKEGILEILRRPEWHNCSLKTTWVYLLISEKGSADERTAQQALTKKVSGLKRDIKAALCKKITNRSDLMERLPDGWMETVGGDTAKNRKNK